MSYTNDYNLRDFSRVEIADAIRPLMQSGAHLMTMNMVIELGGDVPVATHVITEKFEEIQKSDSVNFDILYALKELLHIGFIKTSSHSGVEFIEIPIAIKLNIIHLILKAI